MNLKYYTVFNRLI